MATFMCIPKKRLTVTNHQFSTGIDQQPPNGTNMRRIMCPPFSKGDLLEFELAGPNKR